MIQTVKFVSCLYIAVQVQVYTANKLALFS